MMRPKALFRSGSADHLCYFRCLARQRGCGLKNLERKTRELASTYLVMLEHPESFAGVRLRDLCTGQIDAQTSPPLGHPGHLTSFPAREGGNLINLVFPGAGI